MVRSLEGIRRLHCFQVNERHEDELAELVGELIFEHAENSRTKKYHEQNKANVCFHELSGHVVHRTSRSTLKVWPNTGDLDEDFS